MPRLKVGDKVRFLRDFGYHRKGDVREVTAYAGMHRAMHGEPVILSPDNPYEGNYANLLSPGTLELVNAAPQPSPGMVSWVPLRLIDFSAFPMPPGRVEVSKASQPRACTCPTLLNGHHTGCPYVKEAA